MNISFELAGKVETIAGVDICRHPRLGLMFSTNRHKSLLFEFPSPGKHRIHSFFVFYPFLAIWLRNGRAVDYQLVHPFVKGTGPREECDAMLELPVNAGNRTFIERLFDGHVCVGWRPPEKIANGTTESR